MDFISVRLFSIPAVLKNNEKVIFPFKKVEALFYYLIVNKQATREELADLLWSEESEENARKNVRNAIYKIKKTLNMDIIASPQKSIVILNPEIRVETDLEKFLGDESNSIEAYTGEFLHGFTVKDGERLEEWLSERRDKYRELYISKLYKRIEEDLKSNNHDFIEQYSRNIISVDEFDEKAYRILMRFYAAKGLYNKVIEVYKRLCDKLENELGIAPDGKTKGLYNKIMEARNGAKVTIPQNIGKEFFYGRQEEINVLSNIYSDFVSGRWAKSALIIGEAGIGKTRLKDEFIQNIDDGDLYIIQSTCYQAEEKYFLKPWNSILSKIAEIVQKENIKLPYLWLNVVSYVFPQFAEGINSDIKLIENKDTIKFQAVEDAISGVLKKVSQRKKIIITFDDLQWMDSASLNLLNTIMLHNEGNNIMFICGCRNTFGKGVDELIDSTARYNRLDKIILQRFTQKQVVEFINKAVPSLQTSEEFNVRVFEETEGNTLFIVELLNVIKETKEISIMSSKMQDILKNRFFGVSEEGNSILNIISLFFDGASIEFVKELSGKDELNIIDSIEELEKRFLIKELDNDGSIGFCFTHQKLREYVYMQLSAARKKIFHEKIGLLLERNIKNNDNDISLYSKLIYHYERSGNKVKVLEYSIKNANVYLDFNHELYPILHESGSAQVRYTYLRHEEAVKYIEEIENILNSIKQENYSEEVLRLEIDFLHMKGRYLIRTGRYEEGTEHIKRMIEQALKLNLYDYALKGYRQMIYYCIQVYDVSLMEKYIEDALVMANQHDRHIERGILLRLKGINKTMSRRYAEAEDLLKQSIGLFTAINKKGSLYSINIAAAYNYIGNIRRYNMRFGSALNYYDRAIKLCESNKIIGSISVFATNAGQAAFDMGDYERARAYFEKAINIYKETNTLLARSTAEGYMALLSIKKGNYKEAIEYLKMADLYSGIIKSPYEGGLVFRVKAEIKAAMKNNVSLRNIFKNYLDKDIKEYCSEGIELLEKINGSYEVDILKILALN